MTKVKCSVCGKEINSIMWCDGNEVCMECCRDCCCKCSLLSNITCCRNIMKDRMERQLSPGAWYVVKETGKAPVIHSASNTLGVFRKVEEELGAYQTRPFFVTDKVYVFGNGEKQAYVYFHKGCTIGMTKENAQNLQKLLKRGEEHDR